MPQFLISTFVANINESNLIRMTERKKYKDCKTGTEFLATISIK